MRNLLKILLIGSLALTAGNRLGAAESNGNRDTAITQELQHRLARAPGVDSNFITVTTTNGVVTLSGAVTTVLSRNQAGEVANALSGVSGVKNHIEVLPAARDGLQIARNIADVLSNTPALSSDQIYPRVRDGFVVLTGTVRSWPEHRLAKLLTEGVPGVKGVDNKLLVAYDVPRSDDQIKQDIRSAIRWDPTLNTPELKVQVTGGHVQVQGLVQTNTARQRVYEDSWTTGVKSVNIGGVEVVPNVRLAMEESATANNAAFTANRPSDEQLQATIARSYHVDPLLKTSQAKVRVRDGVVVLHGSVPNSTAKQEAYRIARDFVGANRVVDLLKVEPVQSS